jgi:hypothetical protein
MDFDRLCMTICGRIQVLLHRRALSLMPSAWASAILSPSSYGEMSSSKRSKRSRVAIVELSTVCRLIPRTAHSDEAGQAIRFEAGHLFRREAGRASDLKSATSGVVGQV